MSIYNFLYIMKIWLVWRVNVWKSTIFNRLLWTYRAIVTDVSGTTREIIAEKISFDDDKDCILMDSPWLNDFTEEIKFIETIIMDCDVIIFIVDAKDGIMSNDYKIKELIINHWKKDKTMIVVNKLDSKVYHKDYELLIADFYSLWFPDIIWVSAKQWDGMWDLEDKIIGFAESKWLNFEKIETIIDYTPITIVWRPNVGKSTLLNKLSWEYISQVKEEAGTTLDYMISDITFKNKKYRLFDTVWIRKRWKVKWLEKIAYDKTLSMVKFVRPVLILLIDLIEGVTHRDLSLVGEFVQLNLPVIVWVNKIDEFEKDIAGKMLKKIGQFLDFAKWIPIIPISAKEWIWLPDLLSFTDKIWIENNKRVSTWDLNKALNKAWIETPPRFPKNKVCRFYYATQIEINPPRFKIFINAEDKLNFAFKKWLDNTIRKSFGFVWVPIVFDFEEKEWAWRYSDNK